MSLWYINIVFSQILLNIYFLPRLVKIRTISLEYVIEYLIYFVNFLVTALITLAQDMFDN
jgi:hypothetical protein